MRRLENRIKYSNGFPTFTGEYFNKIEGNELILLIFKYKLQHHGYKECVSFIDNNIIYRIK